MKDILEKNYPKTEQNQQSFGLKQIAETVNSCGTCRCNKNAQQNEPLLPHDIPDQPWMKLATELFQLQGKDYLLVCDYHSKYFEVCKLDTTTSSHVITQLKIICVRHGVPVTLISGNWPQFSSCHFRVFTTQWNIQLVTTSPNFPRANGFIERNIQTVKKLLKKAKESGEDTNLATLNYRTTPKSNSKSPAELFMGRKLRILLPTMSTKSKTNCNRKVKQRHDQNAHKLPEMNPVTLLGTGVIVHGNQNK
ncbi:uncharacterized protein K02A2.6 [Aplysia californica]|uniref:Uncharacterized protein K02A2.6 n=1 Tax=Aplysia californica TaxID=6500 RepID=A0ABM0JAU0_APLCA|nr:uncharacterized protein K02A2.6 [Aplysia californica]